MQHFAPDHSSEPDYPTRGRHVTMARNGKQKWTMARSGKRVHQKVPVSRLIDS
jgi:hypothetical protein